MRPLPSVTGSAAVLDRADVDTDQIIPKQFLKRIERTGFGQFCFFDWRFNEDGSLNPEFELNNPAYRDASVLVAGRNFGCGSSREHAPWALQGHGFKAVISTYFADIFKGNALKNGLLPVVLPAAVVGEALSALFATPGSKVAVDLDAQTVTMPGGDVHGFAIDPYSRHCMLQGLDELDYTLTQVDHIAEYERRFG